MADTKCRSYPVASAAIGWLILTIAHCFGQGQLGPSREILQCLTSLPTLSGGAECPQDDSLEATLTLGELTMFSLPLIPQLQQAVVPNSLLVLLRNHERFDVETGRCEGPLGIGAVQETLTVLIRSAGIGYRSDRRVLPNFLHSYPGMFLRDTCSSPLLTTVHIHEAFDSPQYQTDVARLLDVQQPVYVAGPALSDEVGIVSPALSAQKIPHLSFRATSSTFDNTKEYPFLFRTVPSDFHQVEAIGDLLEHFNWTYIGIVASGDTYGLGGLDGLRQLAARRSICVGLEESFSTGQGGRNQFEVMKGIVHSFAVDEQMTALVLFALEHEARYFLSCLLAKNISRSYTIIAGEDWITRVHLRSIVPDCRCADNVQKCSLPVHLPSVIGYFPLAIGDSELQQAADASRNSSILNVAASVLPWLPSYVENVANCSLTSSASSCNESVYGSSCNTTCPGFNVSTNPSSGSLPPCKWPSPSEAIHLRPLILLANAVVTCVQQIYNEHKATLSETVNVLRNVILPCDSSEAELFDDQHKKLVDGKWYCRAFSSTQSAFPMYHLIRLNQMKAYGEEFEIVGRWQDVNSALPRLNISGLDTSDFPASVCSHECPLGQEMVFSGTIGTCSTLCSVCRACPSVYHIVTVDPGTPGTTCSECKVDFGQGKAYVPNAGRTECVEASRIFTGFNSWEVIFAVSVAGVTVLLLLFTLIFFWQHREKKVVKTVDLKLSTFILIGFIVGVVCTIPLLLEPTDTQCIVAHLLSAPWLDFGTASMLAKVSRINRIFSKKTMRRGSEQSRYSTLGFHVFVICLISFIPIIISVVFTILDPPRPVTEVANRDTMRVFCGVAQRQNFIVFTYSIVVVFFAFVVAFRSRNVPEIYNESYLLFISTFGSLMLIAGLSVVVYSGAATDLLNILYAIVIEFEILMIWGCIFGVRVFHLLRIAIFHTPERRALSSSSSVANRQRRLSFAMRLDGRGSFHLRRMAVDQGQAKHTNLARPLPDLSVESPTPEQQMEPVGGETSSSPSACSAEKSPLSLVLPALTVEVCEESGIGSNSDSASKHSSSDSIGSIEQHNKSISSDDSTGVCEGGVPRHESSSKLLTGAQLPQSVVDGGVHMEIEII